VSYTSEIIVTEVLIAAISDTSLNVERAIRKIKSLCPEGSITDNEIREALIKEALKRGARISRDGAS
jgi:hypothetical protein